MEFFYIVVSIMSVIALILSLTAIGLMIQNGNKTQTFPPNTSQCPDLWIPDGKYCHYNGQNKGNYKSYDTGLTDPGKFLGDDPTSVNFIDKYDLTSSTKPTETKNSVRTTINDNPMKTVPFFTNGGSIYTNSTTINTSDSQWETTGLSANCAKKKWANSNNIEWSGISQLNTC